MAGVASSSTPDGGSARATSLRPPRGRVRNGDVLTPLLLTERLALATPSLDANERSADAGAAKTTKRKRRLLGTMIGVHDGNNADGDENTDACTATISTEVRVVSLELEEEAAAIEGSAASTSDSDHKRSASPADGANQVVGGLVSVPDAGETLVIRKKWRRQVYESSESPSLRCWSAEERVVVREESLRLPMPLRRSVSTLDMHANVPKRPSLERRQLSAAAIDAMLAAAHELALPTIQSKDHPDLNVISPETVCVSLSIHTRTLILSYLTYWTVKCRC